MKQKQSGTFKPRIGVFATWFRGNYQLQLISGIEEAARCLNAQVIYFCGRSLQTPHPYENNCNIVYETAMHASLDGLIIFPILAQFCDDTTLTEFLSRFKNIPIITINHQASFGNAILTNNSTGFKDLMRHLIEVHHFRKLAFLKGPQHNLDAIERFEIYKTALANAEIAFDPALVTQGTFKYNSGQEAAKLLLNQRGLKPGRDMEVVLCVNDTMAVGLIDEFHSQGINVPGDIAVTGADTAAASVFPKNPITSVSQNLYRMGNHAVYSLIDYKPNQPPIFFDTQFILGYSCGCPQPADKQNHTVSPLGLPMSDKIPEADNERSARPVPDVNYHPAIGYIPQFITHKMDLENIFYKVTSIIDNLKGLQKINEFTSWMKNNFPKLGINCAWLLHTSAFTSNDRTYKCIGGYDLQLPDSTGLKDEITETLIFTEFLSNKPNRSFCIMPIYFKEEKYGLLVIEVNEMAYIIYDTLSYQIGGSIKHMHLGEQVTAMIRQLKRTNEQKTQFFINIAHETKTPLTLIQNYLTHYMTNHGPDEDLLIIKQNFDLLLTNMLNYLDVEKLQKGCVIYRHDNFVDLSESARRKCDLFQVMAAKKKIRIILNVENRIIIKADPLALDRVFNNLLDNAVQYTQNGGQVKLDVRSENGKASLSLSDNGPGLPVATFEHIFEPYYLLSQKKIVGRGAGVGLSIVKKIIDELGASIIVEKNEQGGTRFIITFIDSSSLAEQQTLQEIPDSTDLKSLLEAKISENNISEDKFSLLIVDDNIQLLNFLQKSLNDTYNVFLSRNTQEALIKLKVITRPDLIISDIMMDGPDGFQLLSACSTKQGLDDIPFIFLTAMSDEKEKIRGLDLGAVDYIEKPFSIDTLKAKIGSIIALRRKQIQKDIKLFRNKIDKIFTDSDKNMSEPDTSDFNYICNQYGIIGRKKDIIRMLLQGLVHKEIAACLNISQRAVEYHISIIYKKCKVKNIFNLQKKFQR